MYNLLTIRIASCLIGACIWLTSCVDIQGPAPQSLKPDKILSEFRLPVRAIMMKVADTLSLSAEAILMDDSRIEVPADSIAWISQDSSLVYIDGYGRLIGKEQSTTPVGVVASYKLSGTTKADTIPVLVTLDRINANNVRLAVLDSTIVGANASGVSVGLPRVRVDLYNDESEVLIGAEIPIHAPAPVVLSYTSSSGGESVFFSVRNDKGYLGPFWINTSVLLYGSEIADSVLFNGIFPATGVIIGIQSDGEGGIQTAEMLPDDPVPNLQPCGWVLVMSAMPDRVVDVVFSDSSADVSGCDVISTDLLNKFRYAGALSINGNVTGTNVFNLKPTGILPFSLWVRRSNTVGEITYFVRDAITKKRLPISGRFRQLSQY